MKLGSCMQEERRVQTPAGRFRPGLVKYKINQTTTLITDVSYSSHCIHTRLQSLLEILKPCLQSILGDQTLIRIPMRCKKTHVEQKNKTTKKTMTFSPPAVGFIIPKHRRDISSQNTAY